MKKEREIDFMRRVWTERFGEIGYCEECALHGITNYIPFAPYHIAHINSKGARPDLRTTDDNVLFLCKNHHNQMDAKFEGKTREDLLIFPRIEEILNKYKTLKTWRGIPQ